ncbi:DNA cytosine methyltransferase [Dyadobacter pollutisoli]|uniref:Cytosine-specific methyltransferase n=1 Tax=Dyadobacter pollutisoli TaxID=2910158 RepID=A0A9E8NBA4_9BACT|nr:DNA cytosine methyltransferase [Dyadobacter pollutisoli]WAC11232.1 DNA cytosine methyltransferase [Dyadobacter pollutisoli]
MKNYSRNSGRIVLEVDPNLKLNLYDTLAQSGDTMKEWFVREAAHYIADFKHSMDSTPTLPSTPERIITTKKQSKSSTFKVISLFSGCGGLDLGFRGDFEIFGTKYPKNDFDILWANDLNRAACATYVKNFGHDIQCGNIWDMMERVPKSADVVIGGFPCQDISVNGKRAGANGARSGLYKAMVEIIDQVKPKVFVAENVKGLLMKYNQQSLEQVLTDFGKLGYNINYQLYNAADYGVPQTRERVFIVGTRHDVREFTPPKPVRDAATWMTAKEAIGDLESEPKNLNNNHIWSLANVSGEQGNRRLKADRPGYTMRAECHGNIQFHYSEPRRISMREAARFQSFPDKFIFEGGLRETERQVGNAVPPILGWHISKAVRECLR